MRFCFHRFRCWNVREYVRIGIHINWKLTEFSIGEMEKMRREEFSKK